MSGLVTLFTACENVTKMGVKELSVKFLYFVVRKIALYVCTKLIEFTPLSLKAYRYMTICCRKSSKLRASMGVLESQLSVKFSFSQLSVNLWPISQVSDLS